MTERPAALFAARHALCERRFKIKVLWNPTHLYLLILFGSRNCDAGSITYSHLYVCLNPTSILRASRSRLPWEHLEIPRVYDLYMSYLDGGMDTVRTLFSLICLPAASFLCRRRRRHCCNQSINQSSFNQPINVHTVVEMVHCACRLAGREPPDHVTFGEFSVLITELQELYRRHNSRYIIIIITHILFIKCACCVTILVATAARGGSRILKGGGWLNGGNKRSHSDRARP